MTNTNTTVTVVYWFAEEEGPFGKVVDDPAKLTKAQLLEAINNYDRCVVECPDGSFNMFDAESNEYDMYEVDEANWFKPISKETEAA